MQFIEFEAILKFKEKEKPKVFSINSYGEKDKEFNLNGKSKKWILKSDEKNPSLNYYIIRSIEKDNNYTALIIVLVVIIIIALVVIGIIFFIKRSKRQINFGGVGNYLINDKE